MGSLVRLLDVKFEKLTQTGDLDKGELEKLESEYQTALKQMGKNSSTIELMKNLAHMQGFYMDKSQSAQKMLQEAIELPQADSKQVAECKIELADILTMEGDVWEATLLYQQVDKAFKNEPIGHKAKFKNAKLSFYMGQFDWATTQLDVLKAATSKLIANDALQLSLLIKDNIGLDSSLAALKQYAQADLYAFQKKYDLALAKLDSLEEFYVGHNIIDEVLFKKADIKLEKKKYHQADSLYEMIIENYSNDILADDAIMSRAQLNEYQLDNKAKAEALYQKLLKDYPGSLYTVKARKRFRILRGDEINKS
jgi:tetratricopeptide (TPR) repeat protein